MALRLGLLGTGAAVAAALLALTWQGRFVDLWLTSDQHGRWLYERGRYQAAAQAFEDPLWKGIASYAAGDFVAATQIFARLATPIADLYRGNSLAHRGLLEEALAAYRHALARDPALAQAQANIDWVAGLLALREVDTEDDGGSEARLEPDDFVFDDRAQDADRRLSVPEGRTLGLSDAELEAMWMRRVQTTPGDFLALKFSYQATVLEGESEDAP